jgi:hypothetical protein
MDLLKDSVYVTLCGGLGNQLFQIANGYAYSLRYNKNFYISRTWYGLKPERPSYWDSIFKHLQSYLKDPSEFKGTFYREPTWNYKEIPFISGDVIFDGYFQCEKYFEDKSEEIRKLFNIYPEPKSSSDISVAVHIRRGDYLKFPNVHPVLQKEYYDEAKKYIEEKINNKPRYIYFSEDTQWVKETFKNDITEKDKIISDMLDIEEFQMMINCNHFILANSTFSWWASWFADSKQIVAPKIWFGPDFVKDHGHWDSIYRNTFFVI